MDITASTPRIVLRLRPSLASAAYKRSRSRADSCWSNRLAVSEADAFAICHKRDVESEENERQHAAMLSQQQAWLVQRDNVYRRTQAEVLGPRGGSPPLVLKAREAAVAAVLEFERRNPPEKVGWNSSIRSTPPLAEDAEKAEFDY